MASSRDFNHLVRTFIYNAFFSMRSHEFGLTPCMVVMLHLISVDALSERPEVGALLKAAEENPDSLVGDFPHRVLDAF